MGSVKTRTVRDIYSERFQELMTGIEEDEDRQLAIEEFLELMSIANNDNHPHVKLGGVNWRVLHDMLRELKVFAMRVKALGESDHYVHRALAGIFRLIGAWRGPKEHYAELIIESEDVSLEDLATWYPGLGPGLYRLAHCVWPIHGSQLNWHPRNAIPDLLEYMQKAYKNILQIDRVEPITVEKFDNLVQRGLLNSNGLLKGYSDAVDRMASRGKRQPHGLSRRAKLFEAHGRQCNPLTLEMVWRCLSATEHFVHTAHALVMHKYECDRLIGAWGIERNFPVAYENSHQGVLFTVIEDKGQKKLENASEVERMFEKALIKKKP